MSVIFLMEGFEAAGSKSDLRFEESEGPPMVFPASVGRARLSISFDGEGIFRVGKRDVDVRPDRLERFL